jgi:hypothetical protein
MQNLIAFIYYKMYLLNGKNNVLNLLELTTMICSAHLESLPPLSVYKKQEHKCEGGTRRITKVSTYRY